MTPETSYDVVIVGGGIIGVSIAYHLTAQGSQSVCLLERSKLTSGTTWHAAGLVAELRATPNLTRLARYTGELFDNIQSQGTDIGYRRLGALTLATKPARQFELEKLAAMARQNGVDCQWLGAAAISERWPHIDGDSILGGVYLPRDGQTNPVDTTMALAQLARAQGAHICEDSPVDTLSVAVGQIKGVITQGQELSLIHI